MAIVDLAVNPIKRAGLAWPSAGALSAADTYKVPNNGRTFLHFRKAGAGACTVTITTPRTIDSLAVAEHTVNVPATTGDVLIGPFEADTFNDVDDKISFTLSDVVGLTLAVLTI